jgi:predicted transcriptional regulator
MDPKIRTFRNLRSRLYIKNKDLAKRLGLSLSTVAKYGNGDLPIPDSVIETMRAWASTTGGSKSAKAREKLHKEEQIKSYCRHIIYSFFPQFCSTDPGIERSAIERTVNRYYIP